jgi:hypothetical protein
MSTLDLVLLVVAVWLLLLAGITALLVAKSRRSRVDYSDEPEPERRRGGDRRIGLPDSRPVRIERRHQPDRRRRGLPA